MKIFVYGTLKKGGILNVHMDGGRFLKKKKIKGYALYLAPDETYPLLYYTGDKKDVVVGEVWKITRSIKKRLDQYEQGYVLKRMLKLPMMTYYPDFDITHLCRRIPKNKKGRYEFNVEKSFYEGFYKKEIKAVA